MGDDDSDEEDQIDVVYNAAEDNPKGVNRKDPEAEYEGEFGYALIKALRGRSVGRRLKRNLFKFGCFLLICNFALLIITIEAGIIPTC